TAGSNTPSYVWGSCGGTGVTPYWTITLQAAPSDSFQSVTTKPLSYNSANGVSIHNTNASGNGPISTHAGSAFNPLNDGGIGLSGLQVKADHGLAWDGVPRSSVSNFIGDILEGAGWSYGGATICAPVFSDAGLYYFNSLIIFDGTCSNPIGVPWSYGGFIVNTTIVNASGLSPSACMVKGSALLGGRDHPTMYNDYCAGWTYQFGEGNNQPLATLASNLSPTDTTITFNSGPYDDVVSNGIVIDNEVMAVRCVGPSYTTCNATRGLLGTKAASHRAGAYEAPYPFTDGGTNATDAPSSGLALFKSSLYQYPTGMWHMLGIQNTCGTGNSSPCFGQSASSVFINPTTDFRQNSSSPLIGAGQSYTANLGGGTPLANTKDILNQTRPSDAKYDIGAEQFKRR
ncbi:MAG TPA: hypothetical protein VL993_05445, partial [Stellaceae bacterium]|nr:hypothetical protein [Stellaceae bacterium]